MSRLKLIVNPTSGKEEAIAHLGGINERLKTRFEKVDIALTTAEGDHEREAARAAAEGYTHIVAVGGDGTLNGVLNGVAAGAGGLAGVTLGVVPAGTGNDFARALGIPDDPAEAAQRLVDGEVRSVDVGVLNERLFLNTSAGGFIAETSVRVDSELKTLAGRFAYLLGGAQALLDTDPVPVRVTADGRTFNADMLTFVVSNCPYMGGGYRVAPDAVVDDGLLDLAIVRSSPTLEFVAAMRRLSRGDRLSDDEAVYLRAHAFELVCDRATWVNTDGEPLRGTVFTYRVLPRGARFMC